MERIPTSFENDDEDENENSEPARAGLFAVLAMLLIGVLRDLAGPP